MFVPYPSILHIVALQAHFASFIITSSTASAYLLCAISFVTESKQGIEDIPLFLWCEVKVILPLSHTKITSALTVSVTADRRLFILPTHSIWLLAFKSSVMPSVVANWWMRRSNISVVVRSTSSRWLCEFD